MLLLAFLKTNWLPILLAVVALGLVTRYEVVVKERDHYKDEVKVTQAEVKTLKQEIADNNKLAADKAKAAEAAAAELTAKYKEASHQRDQAIEVNTKLTEKQIAQDKELHRIKLSYNAIRLFNATKNMPTTSAQAPAAEPGHDSQATTAGKTTSVTLADALIVVAHNDAKYKKCVETVEEWQNFWTDFTVKYQAIASNAPQP